MIKWEKQAKPCIIHKWKCLRLKKNHWWFMPCVSDAFKSVLHEFTRKRLLNAFLKFCLNWDLKQSHTSKDGYAWGVSLSERIPASLRPKEWLMEGENRCERVIMLLGVKEEMTVRWTEGWCHHLTGPYERPAFSPFTIAPKPQHIANFLCILKAGWLPLIPNEEKLWFAKWKVTQNWDNWPEKSTMDGVTVLSLALKAVFCHCGNDTKWTRFRQCSCSSSAVLKNRQKYERIFCFS